MKLREILAQDDIKYSWTDGGFHKEFTYNGKSYKASLLPFAMSGSACTIIKIDNKDDVNNVTASEDKRRVFYKRYNNFKSENITDSIREFLTDYAR